MRHTHACSMFVFAQMEANLSFRHHSLQDTQLQQHYVSSPAPPVLSSHLEITGSQSNTSLTYDPVPSTCIDQCPLCSCAASFTDQCLHCREVYDAAQTRYRGRCTAPLLLDKQNGALISNESADILRMLNSVSLPGCTDVDLYPKSLQAEIDAVNALVYDKVPLLLLLLHLVKFVD